MKRDFFFKPLILFLSLICFKKIAAQDCKIIPTVHYTTSYFDKLGLIGKEYKNIRDTIKNGIQIMLINNYAYTRNIYAYCVYVDTITKQHKIIVLNQDSIIFSNILANYNIDENYFLFANNKLSGFYFSKCNSSVSFHKSKFLIAYDHLTNKFIEYECFDGRIEEALNGNKDFDYLNNIYNLIVKTFKDLNLYK